MNSTQDLAASSSLAPSNHYRGRLRTGLPRSAGSLRSSLPRQDIFNSGFTVLTNARLDTVGRTLTRSQIRVLEWVQRFTTGYCREWLKQRIELALPWCALTRATFYRARKELVDLGLIELRQDIDHLCWVRLTAILQPLKAEYLASLPLPFTPPLQSHERDSESHEQDMESAQQDLERAEKETSKPVVSTVCALPVSVPKEKQKKENSIERQQQEIPVVVVQPVASAELTEVAASLAADEADEAPSEENKGTSTLEAAVREQAQLLLAAGVCSPRNEILAQTRTAAAIGRALAALALQERVVNAGGWLFQGLNSGRFDAEPISESCSEVSEASQVQNRERKLEAAPPLTLAEREAQRDELRAREVQQAESERRQRDAALAREMADGLGSLSPEALAELRQRAIVSLGKRGPKTLEAIIQGQMLCLFKG